MGGKMNRREWLMGSITTSLTGSLLGAAALGAGKAAEGAQRRRRGGANAMGKLWVFVGTNTGAKSKGIYRFSFDPTTGTAGPVELAAETANPTWVNFHPSGRFLYCVNAVGEFQGKKAGAVSAFVLDRKSGALTFLNQESSGGPGPCHLVVDRAAGSLLVANYGGGSVAVLPLDRDGRLRPFTSFVQHHGASVNPQRQKEPHAHSVNLDAANRFAFVADLGMDQVLIYRFDAGKSDLNVNPGAESARVAPGAGPRHFAFHPNGRYAYVINELNSTVTAFAYHADNGRLEKIQEITTLPNGFTGENYPAEVQVHPSGKFVYGSNRGHDSIAIFRVDAGTGRLTAAGQQPSGGKWPRNFGIDPSGTWMLVGNQNSDNILIHRIDPETGALTPTGAVLEAPAPICFKMIAAE